VQILAASYSSVRTLQPEAPSFFHDGNIDEIACRCYRASVYVGNGLE